MSLIAGNDVVYTDVQIVGAFGRQIYREPTANSTDEFPSTTALMVAEYGAASADFDDESFTLSITNNSAFTITQNMGTGQTLIPDDVTSDVILPGQSRLYNFVVVDGSVPTMNVIIKSASSSDKSGVALASGEILVGQTDGQGAAATVSGDISSISTTGVFTANSATVGLLAGAQTFTGDKTFTNLNVLNSGSFNLLDSDSSDAITLAAPAAVTAYTITLPPAVGSTGQVLQTTDSLGTLAWVIPTAGSLSYYYAYGPAAGFAVTGTQTTVNISVGEIASSGYSNTAGVITITNAGVYKINYTVQFQSLNQTGGVRASFAARVFLNGATEVTGSIVECWIQEQNSTLVRPSVTKTIIVNISASDTIAIQAYRSIGTTTGEVRVNECSVAIEQLA